MHAGGIAAWYAADRSLQLTEQVIALYLLEKYTPDSKLLPATPEDRARARQAARVMDVYITPIQVLHIYHYVAHSLHCSQSCTALCNASA